MKNFVTKNIVAMLALLGLCFLTNFARAEDAQVDTVWAARLNNETSCNSAPSELGETVKELNQEGLLVIKAKDALLKGMFFCKACGCPKGVYHVVEVPEGSLSLEKLADRGFKVVDPSLIVEVKPSPVSSIR